MIDLIQVLANKNKDTLFLTGIVYNIYSTYVEVKIYQNDSVIYAKLTNNCNNIKTGSNVVLLKIGVQFIVMAVISNDCLHRCFLEKNVAQSIPNNTSTFVTFGETYRLYDPLEMHTNTDNTKIIIQKTGYYSVGYGGRWLDSATNTRLMSLLVNGTTKRTVSAGVDSSTNGRMGFISTTKMYLTENDYLQFLVHQGSGGNLNFGGADTYTVTFNVELI